MIQRIQSIFLLLAAILMAATVFIPLTTLSYGQKLFYSFSWGVVFEYGGTQSITWGVLVFNILGVLLPLVNIFLYKKRKLQIKICSFTILVIVAFYGTLYAYLYSIMANESLSLGGIRFGIVMPAIALIFVVLASINIKKDERLIQSLNRIR